jgi:acyl dehydratase
LRVGDLYEHPLGRKVLPTDNSWFALLTQNTAPLHFDPASARLYGAHRAVETTRRP